MTTDTYIQQNKTTTFKKGDKVEMFNCYEATFEKNKGKIWTCQTDSYLDRGKQEVVFLEGFSGCFSAEYLRSVGEKNKKLIQMSNRSVQVAMEHNVFWLVAVQTNINLKQ